MKIKRSMYIAAFFYGLALIMYLSLSVISLVSYKTDKTGEIIVDVENSEYEGIKIVESNENGLKIVTSSIDPYIICKRDTVFRGWNLVLKAEADRPIGEMVLYYNYKSGEDFSEQRKIWAEKNSDGNWFFDLKGRKYSALRLDIDNTGGVVWSFESMVINKKPALSYFFNPGTGGILWFLLVPAFVSAVFIELYSIFFPELCRLKKRFISGKRAKQQPPKAEN